MIYERWTEYVALCVCPACGAVACLTRHARYSKHYFGEQIQIVRVKCRRCNVTHALMPSFSLPGTSGGTEEAERYLKRRQEGQGRGTAGKELQELRVGERYGLQLEKRFQLSIVQAKALFAEAGDPYAQGLKWVESVVEEPCRPVYSLNCYCLQRGVNAVCFSRASILHFLPAEKRKSVSLNLGRFRTDAVRIDSS